MCNLAKLNVLFLMKSDHISSHHHFTLAFPFLLFFSGILLYLRTFSTSVCLHFSSLLNPLEVVHIDFILVVAFHLMVLFMV
jgi:hypothetical protein